MLLCFRFHRTHNRRGDSFPMHCIRPDATETRSWDEPKRRENMKMGPPYMHNLIHFKLENFLRDDVRWRPHSQQTTFLVRFFVYMIQRVPRQCCHKVCLFLINSHRRRSHRVTSSGNEERLSRCFVVETLSILFCWHKNISCTRNTLWAVVATTYSPKNVSHALRRQWYSWGAFTSSVSCTHSSGPFCAVRSFSWKLFSWICVFCSRKLLVGVCGAATVCAEHSILFLLHFLWIEWIPFFLFRLRKPNLAMAQPATPKIENETRCMKILLGNKILQ